MFNIILMTHEDLGEVYIRCASRILGELSGISSISVSPETPSCDTLCRALKSILSQAEENQETLILTDLFGATPCNASLIFQKQQSDCVKIVSGLNFPMLIKALTMRNLPLNEAIDGIISAGKCGIFDATEKMKTLFFGNDR